MNSTSRSCRGLNVCTICQAPLRGQRLLSKSTPALRSAYVRKLFCERQKPSINNVRLSGRATTLSLGDRLWKSRDRPVR